MLQALMKIFKDALDYMYPRKRYKRPPGQTINRYVMGSDVGEQERLLMLLNLARNPQSARALLDEYGVETAAELLRLIPTKPKRSFRSRLKQLALHLSGHEDGDPYRVDQVRDNRNRL